MIKLLAMDVDGSLTDGKIYVGENGELFKVFNCKDGYAIHEMLPAYGITPVLITGRRSSIVENRALELKIAEVYQGVRDKGAKLLEIAASHHCDREEIAFFCDDDNDLSAMNVAGIVGCPANASARVKKVAMFVSAQNGGDGAVREFVEWIIKRL